MFELKLDYKECALIRYCLLTYACELKEEKKNFPRDCIAGDRYKESIDELVKLAKKIAREM